MTRYDNQLDSADPGLYATEPPEMGDNDSLVAMVEGLARHEDECAEEDRYLLEARHYQLEENYAFLEDNGLLEEMVAA